MLLVVLAVFLFLLTLLEHLTVHSSQSCMLRPCIELGSDLEWRIVFVDHRFDGSYIEAGYYKAALRYEFHFEW